MTNEPRVTPSLPEPSVLNIKGSLLGAALERNKVKKSAKLGLADLKMSLPNKPAEQRERRAS